MSEKIFQLSPVDYIFTGAGSQPITFAFYYPQKLNSEILQKSLRETLQYFPTLTSKLVRKGKNEYEYHIAQEELSFNIVESNLSFNESQNIDQYILPVSSKEDTPLAKITLTQTPEGSVLAVSISHTLVDGFSYFHFLASWARICRNDRILIPSLERNVWSAFNSSKGKPINRNDIYSNCGLFWEAKRPEFPKEPIQEERIFISKDTIRSHLEEIKNEYPNLSLFENDIICAFLWKTLLLKWIEETDNLVTHITCPFDFRRVYKNISKTYCGCAICFTTASTDLNTLKKKSIGELAILVNRAIRRVNDEYVKVFLKTLVSLRHQKGISAFEEIHLRHPMSGLIVTNLTRMPIRDLDFGSGIPINFLAYVDVRGGAAILSAENGVEVLVSHPVH